MKTFVIIEAQSEGYDEPPDVFIAHCESSDLIDRVKENVVNPRLLIALNDHRDWSEGQYRLSGYWLIIGPGFFRCFGVEK